jgi:hypothetical protein
VAGVARCRDADRAVKRYELIGPLDSDYFFPTLAADSTTSVEPAMLSGHDSTRRNCCGAIRLKNSCASQDRLALPVFVWRPSAPTRTRAQARLVTIQSPSSLRELFRASTTAALTRVHDKTKVMSLTWHG